MVHSCEFMKGYAAYYFVCTGSKRFCRFCRDSYGMQKSWQRNLPTHTCMDSLITHHRHTATLWLSLLLTVTPQPIITCVSHHAVFSDRSLPIMTLGMHVTRTTQAQNNTDVTSDISFQVIWKDRPRNISLYLFVTHTLSLALSHSHTHTGAKHTHLRLQKLKPGSLNALSVLTVLDSFCSVPAVIEIHSEG